MVKVRLMGLPDEVADLADAMESAGVVLERSEPRANRRGSAYVRVYLDVDVPPRATAAAVDVPPRATLPD